LAHERVLVVDDEPGVREALTAILQDEGYAVSAVESGEDGIGALEGAPFDVVLLDVWLPGIDGIETLHEMRERSWDTPVVMISGHGTIETAVRATKLGAFDFVEKPLSLERVLLVLRNALRQRELERRSQRLLEQLARDTEIVGGSPQAAKLRSEISSAADSTAPVLLSGEPGSGRSTVARRIHGTSPRADRAYVEMPCGALAEAAAAVALFGEKSGPGRLDLAAGGTLFLDDLDRLPPPLQSRLARSLSEAKDARIVGSIGPPPASLHADLLPLLDRIRIAVPPLRERRQDVPILAERYLRELSREYGRVEKKLSPEAVGALIAYDWPGNVRELRNLVERLVLVAPSDVVRASDLPRALGGERAPTRDLDRGFGSLAEGVEAFERYFIRRVLGEERGNLADAARRLGLDERKLADRIRALAL
jgi:two-component system nitrogen regulation response regulator NtrX